MKTVNKVLFLGFLTMFCFPLNSRDSWEREKIIITDPAKPNPTAVTLQANPLPKFTFTLNKIIRIRKTNKAEMYEYNPKNPDKPYRHLAIFMELLALKIKKQLPCTDVVVVAREEFHEISEVYGLTWSEPSIDSSAKPKGGLLWFTKGGVFKIFLVNLKSPERVLTLEQFLTHLALLSEWESEAIKVNPEDADTLIDKRQEAWKRQEGKAYALFQNIARHYRLLQLNWPVTMERPKIFSIPIPVLRRPLP